MSTPSKAELASLIKRAQTLSNVLGQPIRPDFTPHDPLNGWGDLRDYSNWLREASGWVKSYCSEQPEAEIFGDSSCESDIFGLRTYGHKIDPNELRKRTKEEIDNKIGILSNLHRILPTSPEPLTSSYDPDTATLKINGIVIRLKPHKNEAELCKIMYNEKYKLGHVEDWEKTYKSLTGQEAEHNDHAWQIVSGAATRVSKKVRSILKRPDQLLKCTVAGVSRNF